MDSASIHGPATRLSWMSAQAITPVRPSPPMVARNMSEFSSELQITSPSFDRCRADLADVSTESSSTMMVLTVDVVGDGSADSDEASAGRDRKEPSFREKYVENVGEADAAFAAEHASRFVESEDAVKAAAVDQFSAGVETRVAIAAAEAIGEQGPGRGSFENVRYLVVPRRPVNVMVRSLRVTAPRENSLGGRRRCGLLAQSVRAAYDLSVQYFKAIGDYFATTSSCIMLAAITAADASATP